LASLEISTREVNTGVLYLSMIYPPDHNMQYTA